MVKNYRKRYPYCRQLMRLSLLTMLFQVFVLSALATSFASAQDITLEMKQGTVRSIFFAIEKQAGVSFTFNEKTISKLPSIDISISKRPLTEVLAELERRLPIRFRQIGKTIAVSSKQPNKNPSAELTLIPITGTVKDENDKPIPGATIRIKGRDVYAITDNNGNFRIEAQANETLQITYLGYTVQEYTIINGNPINIKLSPDTNTLQEVSIVSTGYQDIPKERVTGSFVQIDKEVYEKRISPNILDRLNGIASGLAFNKGPDGNEQLRIRGQSTIFANAEPLIVLNGFPYDGDLSSINPNDIEDITLLRDAAAASIWGVRAGNGVIVITTKKGRFSAPAKIDFTSNLTVGAKDDIYYNPEFLNSSDFIDVEKSLFAQNYYTEEGDARKSALSPVVEILIKQRDGLITPAEAEIQIDRLRKLDVRNDMDRYLYRASFNQQYAISMTGGTEKINFLGSAGFDRQELSRINNSSNRFTFNSSLEYKPLKRLSIRGGLIYTRTRRIQDYITDQITSGNNNIYPYAEFLNDDGSHNYILKEYRESFINSAPSKGFLDWSFRPLDEIGKYTNSIISNDVRLNAGLNYSILDGLNFDLGYVYQTSDLNGQRFADANSYFSRDLINKYSTVSASEAVTKRNIPVGSIIDNTTGKLVSESFRAQINFNKSLNRHYINAISGIEIRQVKNDTYNARLYGYNNETGVVQVPDYTTNFVLFPTGNGTQRIPFSFTRPYNGLIDRYQSFYSNASYSYDQRYTLSLSARIDQSNFFGVRANQRAVPLWSLGIKWDLDKEPFFKIKALDKLTIRSSIGYNGNIDRSITAYSTANFASQSTFSGLPYAVIQSAPNADLRWERSRIINMGVDFALLKSRIGGTIEVFSKKGTDLSGDAAFPPSSGISSLRGNYADLKGSGIDVILNGKILDGTFKWSMNGLFSYAKEEVTRFQFQNSVLSNYVVYGAGRSTFIYPMVGKPVYGIYAYPFAGLDQNGNPVGYINGIESQNYSTINSPKSEGDIYYAGPARPTVNGGFSNTLNWKAFSLFFNFNYKFGYYFRRSTISYSSLFSSWIGHKDFERRWIQPGDENYTNVPSMPTVIGNVSGRDGFYALSTANIEKGDFIRLQDISLSYDVKLPGRTVFRSLRTYIYCNNMGIIWRENKQGIDPDYVNGIPPSRNFTLGLKVGM